MHGCSWGQIPVAETPVSVGLIHSCSSPQPVTKQHRLQNARLSVALSAAAERDCKSDGDYMGLGFCSKGAHELKSAGSAPLFIPTLQMDENERCIFPFASQESGVVVGSGSAL